MTRISVIIPAFNSGEFIAETLKSVRDQTFPIYEIIVVDDGSTDNTADVVATWPEVNYRYQPNSGTVKAVNNGVSAATGDLLAFLDHDDLWLPDKLEKQMIALRNDPSLELVFTLLENFFSSPLSEVDRQKIMLDTRILVGIQRSTLLVKRDTFMKVGPLASEGRVDFMDWYARAREMNVKQYVVPEVLVKRRVHGANITLTDKNLRVEYPRVLKAILDRRRSLK